MLCWFLGHVCLLCELTWAITEEKLFPLVHPDQSYSRQVAIKYCRDSTRERVRRGLPE